MDDQIQSDLLNQFGPVFVPSTVSPPYTRDETPRPLISPPSVQCMNIIAVDIDFCAPTV